MALIRRIVLGFCFWGPERNSKKLAAFISRLPEMQTARFKRQDKHVVSSRLRSEDGSSNLPTSTTKRFGLRCQKVRNFF